jgi:hypothetical protein
LMRVVVPLRKAVVPVVRKSDQFSAPTDMFVEPLFITFSLLRPH